MAQITHSCQREVVRRNNNTRHPLLHEQFGNTLIDSSSPFDCVCGVGVWVVCVCVLCVCCVSVCGLRRSCVGVCVFRVVSDLWSCVVSSSVPSSFLSSLSSCRCCVVSVCSVRHAFFVHTPAWHNKTGLVAYFVVCVSLGIRV